MRQMTGSGDHLWPSRGAVADRRTPLTIALDRLAEDQRWLAGGKAANLAVLIRSGLRVPPGYCVTAAAFSEFLDSCSRRADLFRTLSQVSAGRPDEMARWSEQALACIEGVPMSPAVEQAVLAAWRGLGEERDYAVRSSATVEDAHGHSFAGQFESVLNVRGREALLGAIKKCWLSLYSPRVLAYHARERLLIEKTSMAVVVQEMVPAEVSGVVFTVDPVSGDVNRMMIEGVPGLADRLVSGQVTPECIALDKARLRVLERRTPIEPSCLNDSLARRLGKMARKAERVFGGPQDIEWAVAGGRVYLLQSRPVTAAQPARSWEDRQMWSNINTGEVAPDVMTPVTWSMIRLFLHQAASSTAEVLGADMSRAPIVGLVAGRIYFNANTGLATIRPFPRAMFEVPRIAEALGGAQVDLWRRGLLRIPDEGLPDLGFSWPKYLLSLPRVILNLIAHSPRRGDAWTAKIKARNDARRSEDFMSMSTLDLVERFRRLLDEGFKGWDLLYLGTQAASLLVFQAACRDWLDDPDLTLGYRLFSGLGAVPEAEAALSLWRMAALAHSSHETEAVVLSEAGWSQARPRLELTQHGRQFLAAWGKFMSEHGHHCRGELELFNARWSENPDYVLGLVRGYLRAIDQVNPVENQRRLAQERERLTEECRHRLRNPLKRWVFLKSLRRAQKLAVNREEWKNQAVRHLTVLREILLALGKQLEQSGVLAHADDVFFLEMTEIEPVATGLAHFDARAAVIQRRAEYEKNLTLSPPPIVVGRFDPATPAVLAPDASADSLRGIPVYPGIVTGPARVIMRADDHEHVLPGEILVAPFTDPAWTPYFVTAAGVVMDQGGILSHGSIVAREYGLPAVTNVGGATRSIRTGDLVQVDGSRGCVTLMKRNPPASGRSQPASIVP